MRRFSSSGVWITRFLLVVFLVAGAQQSVIADPVFRIPSSRAAYFGELVNVPPVINREIGLTGRIRDTDKENLVLSAASSAMRSFPSPNGSHAHTLPGEAVAALAAQVRCLALNIYWEARSESLKGKIAVAQVTLNRVNAPNFPDTICGVVRQGRAGVLHQCQFSWFCDGRKDLPRNKKAWRTAQDIAYLVLLHATPDPTGGALWYHADYVSPSWSRAMTRTTQIGRHIYYVRG